MKTMLHHIGLFVVLTVMIISCNQKKAELKEFIERFNTSCPLSLGEFGTINSVTFDGNSVEVKLSSNESEVSVSELDSHIDNTKEIIGINLSKRTSQSLVDKIIEANADLRMIIIGTQFGSRLQVDFTTEELKQIKEKYSYMSEAQKVIASNVLGMIVRLPLKIDDMTTLTNISNTSNALMYKYEVNDRETGESLNMASGLMKGVTMSQIVSQVSQGGFVGERNRLFYQALIESGKSISVEYYELNTRNKTSFTISPSEIKEILSGKYQQNAPTMDDWNNLNKALEELEYSPDTIWGDY